MNLKSLENLAADKRRGRGNPTDRSRWIVHTQPKDFSKPANARSAPEGSSSTFQAAYEKSTDWVGGILLFDTVSPVGGISHFNARRFPIGEDLHPG